MKHMLERRRNKNHTPPVTHKDWIEDRVLEYLKSGNCSLLMRENSEHETHVGKVKVLEIDPGKNIPKMVEILTSEYQLTDAECLQILNLMPKEVVDLHLLIQDLDERLSIDRQQKLLELIAAHAYESKSTIEEIH